MDDKDCIFREEIIIDGKDVVFLGKKMTKKKYVIAFKMQHNNEWWGEFYTVDATSDEEYYDVVFKTKEKPTQEQIRVSWWYYQVEENVRGILNGIE